MVSYVTWGEGMFCHDVITHPDTSSKQRSLTTDKSDFTGTIRKSQSSNSVKCTRTVMLCIQFLISLFFCWHYDAIFAYSIYEMISVIQPLNLVVTWYLFNVLPPRYFLKYTVNTCSLPRYKSSTICSIFNSEGYVIISLVLTRKCFTSFNDFLQIPFNKVFRNGFSL